MVLVWANGSREEATGSLRVQLGWTLAPGDAPAHFGGVPAKKQVQDEATPMSLGRKKE